MNLKEKMKQRKINKLFKEVEIDISELRNIAELYDNSYRLWSRYEDMYDSTYFKMCESIKIKEEKAYKELEKSKIVNKLKEIQIKYPNIYLDVVSKFQKDGLKEYFSFDRYVSSTFALSKFVEGIDLSVVENELLNLNEWYDLIPYARFFEFNNFDKYMDKLIQLYSEPKKDKNIKYYHLARGLTVLGENRLDKIENLVIESKNLFEILAYSRNPFMGPKKHYDIDVEKLQNIIIESREPAAIYHFINVKGADVQGLTEEFLNLCENDEKIKNKIQSFEESYDIYISGEKSCFTITLSEMCKNIAGKVDDKDCVDRLFNLYMKNSYSDIKRCGLLEDKWLRYSEKSLDNNVLKSALSHIFDYFGYDSEYCYPKLVDFLEKNKVSLKQVVDCAINSGKATVIYCAAELDCDGKYFKKLQEAMAETEVVTIGRNFMWLAQNRGWKITNKKLLELENDINRIFAERLNYGVTEKYQQNKEDEKTNSV